MKVSETIWETEKLQNIEFKTNIVVTLWTLFSFHFTAKRAERSVGEERPRCAVAHRGSCGRGLGGAAPRKFKKKWDQFGGPEGNSSYQINDKSMYKIS